MTQALPFRAVARGCAGGRSQGAAGDRVEALGQMPHGRRQGTHRSLPVERGAYGGCVIDSTSTAAISASRYRERRPALFVDLALIWRDREPATDERRVLRMTPTPDRLWATGTSRGPQRVSGQRQWLSIIH